MARSNRLGDSDQLPHCLLYRYPEEGMIQVSHYMLVDPPWFKTCSAIFSRIIGRSKPFMGKLKGLVDADRPPHLFLLPVFYSGSNVTISPASSGFAVFYDEVLSYLDEFSVFRSQGWGDRKISLMHRIAPAVEHW